MVLHSQNNLEKEQAGSLMLPDFKIYYEITTRRTVWYCHKYKHEENGTE
jgi:hypothetical protein